MVETVHQGEAQRLLRVLKGRGWMTFRAISQSLKNRLKSKELRDMLDGLVDGGDLERREDQPPAGGHKIKSYRIAIDRAS
jgi:predicted ArsR family transcriptional regulator